MTDIASPSPRDIRLNAGIIPVLDDLSALDGLLPDLSDPIERYAALLDRLPSLRAIQARVAVHAGEYQRLLALAEVDPSALEDRVHAANALALLAHAGELALFLLPALSAEDRVAQALVAVERDQQYVAGRGVHDHGLMRRALRTTLGRSAMYLDNRMEQARPAPEAVGPEDRPGDGIGPVAHRLEDALALEASFAAPPDLTDLLEQALGLFEQIKIWAEGKDRLSQRYGARRGALILAYGRLCRIGLWPARSERDLAAKRATEFLLSERTDDPDPMRALAEIALGVGERMARQGPPFLTGRNGVEL